MSLGFVVVRSGKALLPVLAALVLSACNRSVAECGSDGAKSVVSDILKDAVRKHAAAVGQDEETGARLSLSKIRAAVEQLRITLEDVRTTRTDPNSTKRFCAANLTLVFPAATLDDADAAREAVALPTVASTADNLDIEHSADTYQVAIEYEVQPTDTGDRLFAEIEGLESFSNFVGETIASALSRTRLEDGRRETQAQEMSQRAAEELASAEGQKLALETAQAESRLATQSINALWKELGSSTRAQLLPAQRAWVRKKEADCRLEAAQSSTLQSAAETARLGCDARLTRERYTYLEQFRGYESQPSVPDASAPEQSPDDL